MLWVLKILWIKREEQDSVWEATRRMKVLWEFRSCVATGNGGVQALPETRAHFRHPEGIPCDSSAGLALPSIARIHCQREPERLAYFSPAARYASVNVVSEASNMTCNGDSPFLEWHCCYSVSLDCWRRPRRRACSWEWCQNIVFLLEQ